MSGVGQQLSNTSPCYHPDGADNCDCTPRRGRPFTCGWKTKMTMTHAVRSWAHFFDAIKAGKKLHDLRKDDRSVKYAVGDRLLLQRYDNIEGTPTGETLTVEITYITGRDTPCAFSSSVLQEGYVILSIRIVEP